MSSDTIVFQYRYIRDGVVFRSSMSIDPVLFNVFAKRMGSTEGARDQLRRWARRIAESDEGKERASVSRRVHRHVYELLDDA